MLPVVVCVLVSDVALFAGVVQPEKAVAGCEIGVSSTSQIRLRQGEWSGLDISDEEPTLRQREQKHGGRQPKATNVTSCRVLGVADNCISGEEIRRCAPANTLAHTKTEQAVKHRTCRSSNAKKKVECMIVCKDRSECNRKG